MKRTITTDIEEYFNIHEGMEESRIYKKIRKLNELLQIDKYVNSLCNESNCDFFSDIDDVSVKFIKKESDEKDEFPPMKFHLKFKFGQFYFICSEYLWLNLKVPNKIVMNQELFEDHQGICVYKDKINLLQTKDIIEEIPIIKDVFNFIHNISIEYCGYDVFDSKYWKVTQSAYQLILPDFLSHF